MNREQRRRMAYKGIAVWIDGEQITVTVRVSGPDAEILCGQTIPGYDDVLGGEVEEMCMKLSTNDLKSLIATAQWCLDQSEAFEKTHPK